MNAKFRREVRKRFRLPWLYARESVQGEKNDYAAWRVGGQKGMGK
jgi:hypothetical protein